MKVNHIGCASALSLLLAAGMSTARAQDYNQNQSSQGEQWYSEHGSSQAGQSGTRMSGRIESLRQLNLRNSQGTRELHSLAKIRLGSGRLITADLGPKNDLSDLDLQKGDQITLWGHRGTVDGQPAFFADRLRAGEQTVNVARAGSNEEQSQFGPQGAWANSSSQSNESSQFNEQGGRFTVRGKVTGYQVITAESGQRKVSLLNLRLSNGRSVLIDAGNDPKLLDLKDLDIQDRVVIKGHTEDMNGREVMVADNVQFLNPEQGNATASGQAGQRQQSSGGGSSQNENQNPSGQSQDNQQ